MHGIWLKVGGKFCESAKGLRSGVLGPVRNLYYGQRTYFLVAFKLVGWMGLRREDRKSQSTKKACQAGACLDRVQVIAQTQRARIRARGPASEQEKERQRQGQD